MADDFNRLLMYIVEHPLRQVESREVELDASAVQDVAAEVEAMTQELKKDAAKLAPNFEEGLRKAAAHPPLVVDDTSADGNKIAEAFARYLVVPGLATSQSTELPDNHFSYTFDVNWDALRALAQQAGINLDKALRGTQ